MYHYSLFFNHDIGEYKPTPYIRDLNGNENYIFGEKSLLSSTSATPFWPLERQKWRKPQHYNTIQWEEEEEQRENFFGAIKLSQPRKMSLSIRAKKTSPGDIKVLLLMIISFVAGLLTCTTSLCFIRWKRAPVSIGYYSLLGEKKLRAFSNSRKRKKCLIRTRRKSLNEAATATAAACDQNLCSLIFLKQ